MSTEQEQVVELLQELSKDDHELADEILWSLTAYPAGALPGALHVILEQLQLVQAKRKAGESWDKIFQDNIEAIDKVMADTRKIYFKEP